MSFADEPVPVEVGEDGLSRSDWDEINNLVHNHAAVMKARSALHPSISARQAAANAEAMRLRVLTVWRRRLYGL